MQTDFECNVDCKSSGLFSLSCCSVLPFVPYVFCVCQFCDISLVLLAAVVSDLHEFDSFVVA